MSFTVSPQTPSSGWLWGKAGLMVLLSSSSPHVGGSQHSYQQIPGQDRCLVPDGLISCQRVQNRLSCGFGSRSHRLLMVGCLVYFNPQLVRVSAVLVRAVGLSAFCCS